ncbi:response regulator transcription factor [Phaeovulum sp. NW3]|uniref:response regulator transcription factor n=1 Tax=Phaeovulum sp. NW3 TaxID=2934933 RepID=UPI0020206437|nr:response regulator transcription factor [Phaeovulum sp. NW3]MCL7466316.1 response regulator transcription factor [Phaeovulum sp. NW3]
MHILIADAEVLVREVIADFIERRAGGRVAQATTLQEALDAARTSGPFDLILREYKLVGMNGLRRMLTSSRGRPVALLSANIPRPIVSQALVLRAAGYVPKTLSGSTFLNVIRFLMLGERFIPHDLIHEPEQNDDPGSIHDRIEIEVLRRICEGKTNRKISVELGIPDHAVKVHLKTIFAKLDVTNRTAAAIAARDLGLV